MREADSVFTFENRCRIEHWFSGIGDAMDLSLQEWMERLVQIIEIENWKRGAEPDPIKRLLQG